MGCGARYLGGGVSCDAYGMTDPHPEGPATASTDSMDGLAGPILF